jgi:Outer membrane protein
MKNLFKTLIVVICFIFSVSASAQTNSKIGHLDFAKLYSMMPGMDSIQKVFANYQQTIKGQYEAMQTELEGKYSDYQTNAATMSAIIKQTKEKEIQDLQDRMQAFQQNAQQDLQAKETELTTPIIEKAKKGVRDIAKENGYTYILNSGDNGVTILYTAENSDNILPLVMKKLGISENSLKENNASETTAPKETTTPQETPKKETPKAKKK